MGYTSPMGITINPFKLKGPWRCGYALDLHTTKSTPIGENPYGRMQFHTERPEIAEHLYQLKYNAKADAAGPIIETAVEFLKPKLKRSQLLVPVPPSKQRQLQPVLLLADGIATGLGIPVRHAVTIAQAGHQIKDVKGQEEKKKALEGKYAVDAKETEGKTVLLFDDLYDSGSTLNEITRLLLNEGKATEVNVLTITITKAGSNQ